MRTEIPLAVIATIALAPAAVSASDYYSVTSQSLHATTHNSGNSQTSSDIQVLGPVSDNHQAHASIYYQPGNTGDGFYDGPSYISSSAATSTTLTPSTITIASSSYGNYYRYPASYPQAIAWPQAYSTVEFDVPNASTISITGTFYDGYAAWYILGPNSWSRGGHLTSWGPSAIPFTSFDIPAGHYSFDVDGELQPMTGVPFWGNASATLTFLSAVPEPATAGLLALGAALLLRRRPNRESSR